MWIGVEGNDCGVREKAGNLVFGVVSVENLVIDARQVILLKTADGFCRSQNCAPNAGFIEPDEGAVAFLDFNNAVLDSHARSIERKAKKLRKFSLLYLSNSLLSDTVTLC
jgi:hypothetical protein